MKKLLIFTITMILMIGCNSTSNDTKSTKDFTDKKIEKHILYHEFDETSSDQHIKRWNISKDSLPTDYVMETVDDKGKVIELKFYKNNSLKYDKLCYLSSWIKYEYPDDKTVIAYFLNSEGNEDADIECEMASKCTYTLSDDKKTISNTKSEYNLDKDFYLKNGWNEDELNKTLEYLNSEQTNHKLILYLDKSFSKMNGIFPVSKDFNIDDLMYNVTEKNEILKIIK